MNTLFNSQSTYSSKKKPTNNFITFNEYIEWLRVIMDNRIIGREEKEKNLSHISERAYYTLNSIAIALNFNQELPEDIKKQKDIQPWKHFIGAAQALHRDTSRDKEERQELFEHLKETFSNKLVGLASKPSYTEDKEKSSNKQFYYVA